jgi:competence protein ComEC
METEADPDRLAVLAAGLVLAIFLAPWLDDAGLLLIAAAIGGAVALLARSPIAAGFAGGALIVASIAEGPALDGQVVLEGAVIGAPVGSQADVEVRAWSRPGRALVPSSGRVRVRFGSGVMPPAPGTGVVVVGNAGPFSASLLPGDPDPVRNARRSRVRTLVFARSWAVPGAQPRPPDAFDGLPNGPVLRALATGDRSGIDPATNALLQRTGTSHVLSISGFHVGIVAFAVGGALRWTLRQASRWRSSGIPDGPAWMVGALCGVAYAWAAGAPSSAQRAAFMVVFAAIAHARGREVRPLALLGASAILVLIADPASLGTAAFQLSFGAMLGLIRVTPWLLKFVPPDQPRPIAWLASATATTFGATIGTLPASAWWFQQLPPTAPLANLVVLPWITFLVVPFAFAGALLPGPLAHLAAWLGDRSMAGLILAMTPLAIDPWAPALGPIGALACTLVLVLPRRSTLVAAAVLLLWTAREPAPDGPVITFLDVGQGNAALVEDGDRRVLIDGGPPGDGVVKWLRRRGVSRLDLVVATHGHADHVGGLLPVVRGLEVAELWLPSGAGANDLVLAALVRGTRLRFRPEGILAPDAGFATPDLNDISLATIFADTLFPGDVGGEAEAVVASRTPRVAVLAVPHHGSAGSSGEALLEASDPAIAVVSCGRFNKFGHPHDQALARYAARGIPVYRTDRQGTIEVTVHPDDVRVRTFAAGTGWSEPTTVPIRH